MSLWPWRLSHSPLSLQANYTWAKNISDAQGSDAPTVFALRRPIAAEVANRFDVASDRGSVVGTPRQRLLITGIYQLPFGTGRTCLTRDKPNDVPGDWNLRLGASFTNALNHSNYAPPATNIGSPSTFGVLRSARDFPILNR